MASIAILSQYRESAEKGNVMLLSDINDLDDVCRELGIQDSHVTPTEAVRELKAEIERLSEHRKLLKQARLFVELASDIGDKDDIGSAKALLPKIDAALL
jgi:hypothetical protein